MGAGCVQAPDRRLRRHHPYERYAHWEPDWHSLCRRERIAWPHSDSGFRDGGATAWLGAFAAAPVPNRKRRLSAAGDAGVCRVRHPFLPAAASAPAFLRRLEPGLDSGRAGHGQRRLADRDWLRADRSLSPAGVVSGSRDHLARPWGAVDHPARQAAAGTVVRRDLADPRFDIHVPADRLLLRPAP